MPKNFEELKIWQEAHKLTIEIYKITVEFPKSEKFNITDQIKRSVSSIGANIAEAHGRYHYADVIRFLYQARGSLQETRNHLMLARDLGYLESEICLVLNNRLEGLARGINAYITSLKNFKNSA